MAWSDDKPQGTIPVRELDNQIRDQFLHIKDVFQQHCVFPGTLGADAGDMLEGSARCFIDTSTNVGSPPTSLSGLASATGAIAYLTDTGEWWICTNGSGDEWAEITSLGGDLRIVHDSSGARSPVIELVDSGEDPPTNYPGVIVPEGREWLDNGAETMDPFALSARLLSGGGDHLPNVIEGFTTGYDGNLSGLLSIGENAGLSVSRGFNTRAGDSRVLVIGLVSLQFSASSPGDSSGDVFIRMDDGSASDSDDVKFVAGIHSASEIALTGSQITAVALFENVGNVAGVTFEMVFRFNTAAPGGNARFRAQTLIVIDLGEV